MAMDVPCPTPSKSKVEKKRKSKKTRNVQDIPTVEAAEVESSEAVNKEPKKEVCFNISHETTSIIGSKMDKDAPCPTPSKPKVEKTPKTTKDVQEQPVKNEKADDTSIAPHHEPGANVDEAKSNTSVSSQVPVKSLKSAVLPEKEENSAIQIAEKKSEINLPLHTFEPSVEESASKSAITASSTVQMTDKQQIVLVSQKTKETQDASKHDNTSPLKVHEKVEIPHAISTAEVKGHKPDLSPKSQSPFKGAEVKFTTAVSSKTFTSHIETPKQIDPVQQSAKQTEEPAVTGEAKVAKDMDTEDASKPQKGKKKKQKSPAVKQVPAPISETQVTTAQDAGQVEGPEQVATTDSAKTSPEGMRAVVSVQPTAVQNEAPVHKGEVEPEKREVLRGKTSSSQTQREAPAASAQLTPLPKRGEPPSVAQHTAAPDTQQSSEQQRSKAPVLTGPLPANKVTCDVQKQSTDDAMRKKIVVVEEVIEVQQIASPVAGEPATPALTEVAGDDLDYDVLEELAKERGLLSDEETWDHSLQEPEGKVFPNFIEGMSPFFSSITLMAVAPLGFPSVFAVWEVQGDCCSVGIVVLLLEMLFLCGL